MSFEERNWSRKGRKKYKGCKKGKKTRMIKDTKQR